MDLDTNKVSGSLPPRQLLSGPIAVKLPLAEGIWLALRGASADSPGHGTDFLGQAYAIDFVGVSADSKNSVQGNPSWRDLIWRRPPCDFVGFGRSVIAPAPGQIVQVVANQHDRYSFHSPIGLFLFSLAQPRLSTVWSLPQLFGNYVVMALDCGVYALFAHLRHASIRVQVGQNVATKQQIAMCGNTGNSTQPHLHFQLMDGPDPLAAQGVMVEFASYHEQIGDNWQHITREVPMHHNLLHP